MPPALAVALGTGQPVVLWDIPAMLPSTRWGSNLQSEMAGVTRGYPQIREVAIITPVARARQQEDRRQQGFDGFINNPKPLVQKRSGEDRRAK